MNNRISQLKNHYIVCGAGQTGCHIIAELRKTNREFVIIDKDSNALCQYENSLYIAGDANDDNVLKSAKIDSAAGLFAALPTDEDNMFLTITAHSLKPGLRIIVKAVKENSAPKLAAAGAVAVVQPNLIGGMRMASEMVRPHATSFLDKMLKEGKGDLRVDEIEIKSGLIKKLGDIDFKKTGALPLASVTRGGYKFNPGSDSSVEEGDRIIVMGDTEQLLQLRKIV